MSSKVRLFALLLALLPVLACAEPRDATEYASSPPGVAIMNGVLIAPAKAAADSLGASITLEQKRFVITRGTAQFRGIIDSTVAMAGETPVTLVKAPFLGNDRLYLPFAPLVRALAGTVTLDKSAGYVYVTLPDRPGRQHYPLIAADQWDLTQSKDWPSYMEDVYGLPEATTSLFVINIDGTGLRSIVSGAGSVTYPAFSPDGTRLVYIRENKVCLRSVDKPDETFLFSGKDTYRAPYFTPDGKYILFQGCAEDDESSQEIIRINAGGGDIRQLATGKRCSISADGGRIAYTVDDDTPHEMWVMDIDGNHKRALGKGKNPSFSPDGTTLLYEKSYTVGNTSVDQLVTCSLTGVSMSADPSVTAETPGEHYGQFSPDGHSILCQAKGLTLMATDRSTVTKLTSNKSDTSPVFTRDGQTIVYARKSDAGLTALRDLFSEDDEEYSLLSMPDDYSLMSIKPDGTEEMDIQKDMDVDGFAVAPNGRQIVFVSGDDIPQPDESELLREGKPAYTAEEVERYVQELVPLIEEAAGRTFTTRPTIKLVKRRQLVPVLAKELEIQMRQTLHNDAADFASMARVISDSVQPALLGKYAYRENTLYLLPGNIESIIRAVQLGPMYRDGLLKLLIAHELTHALHDQQLDISAQMVKATSVDRLMAYNGVLEGFAIYVQEAVAEKLKMNSTAREMARMLVTAVSAGSPEMVLWQQGAMTRQRDIYLGGRDFLEWHVQHNGTAVPWSILAHPPTKTRELLHPELYSSAAAEEIDYTPVLEKAGEDLRVIKSKQLCLEMGDIALRSFPGFQNVAANDAVVKAIDQFYLLTGKKKDDALAAVMLVSFNDPTQSQAFITAIENMQAGQADGAVKGDKVVPLVGVTGERVRKRVMAFEDRRAIVISVVRGKTLVMLELANFTMPDTQVAAVVDAIFAGVQTLQEKPGAVPAH